MADAKIQYDEHVKAFFLDLAAKGKEAWNAWRRDPANGALRVTFAGIDFCEAPKDRIDFSGFDFGDYANFSGCNWRGVDWAEIVREVKGFKGFTPGRACFTGAAFGNYASFERAAFGNRASFDRAAFGIKASFDHAAFGEIAVFDGAAFGDYASFDRTIFGFWANFVDAVFGREVSFDGAAFSDIATFRGAVFGETARFTGAAFGNGAIFIDTIFKGGVQFTGKSNDQWNRNLEATADEKSREARVALEQRHVESWTSHVSGPDRFLTISFADARFDGEANFSGRNFERGADFADARFYYPPDFDPATNAARINFTGATIGFVRPGRPHWTFRSSVPVRLRALRKIAEDAKNHDLERDLYIEEREAERGVYLVRRFLDWVKDPKRKWALIAHLLWIAVMGVYWVLADYGRSFARPVTWLAVSVWLFRSGYAAILAPLMPQAGTLDAAKYARAEWMVALGNAVPVVGPLTIDAEIKKFLFCPGFGPCLPIPPEHFQFLVIAQNVLSIILVFFIGLALRNYFRIK